MKQRLFWADVIRIIAIYFVVVIHNAITPTSSDLLGILLATIAQTCVPLFIILSGALLLEKKESLKIFFKKRFSKVIFPWIAWTFIFMAWNYYFHHYHPTSLSQWKYFFELTFFTQLWFLPLIVGVYLLTPIWRIFVQNSNKQHILYFLLVWFIFASLLPYVHPNVTFPAESNGFFMQAIVYSGYFILGYAIVQKIIPYFTTRILLSIFLVSVLWSVADFIFLHKMMTFLSPSIVLCSAAFFTLLFRFFKKQKHIPHVGQQLIRKMSMASFGIYIIHQLVIEVLYPFLLPLRNWLLSVESSLIGISLGLIYFLISFVLVYLLQKIPVVKYLLP